jgi:protein O-mannosyl-transferase
MEETPRTRNPRLIRGWCADWTGCASAAVLAVGTVAIYARTFAVPLLLDDGDSIANNRSIRQLWPITPVFSPPASAGVGGRPVLNLSYALNYAASGTAVAGYHLVNLLIHVLSAWALFGLVRRTLRRPVLAARFDSAATGLALAVSAVWAWHPVQTESVTYISQRAESLMGLFYLLTLYCFVRGVESDTKNGRRNWFSLSVLACLGGVGIKEVIVTAPLLIFLYDRTFIAGSFGGAWRQHRWLYLALAASWLPLGYSMIDLHARGMGFGQGVSWWAYGIAECRIVVKYVLLVLWPHPLVFDYGPYVAAPMAVLWPYALILAALLALTFLALRRAPVVGFAACWFWVILAPASSIVPVAGQPMAENRLYLPLAGIAALAILGCYALAGRRSLPVVAAVAAALSLASVRRNQDYASEETLWKDTVLKNPANARAHNNLGSVWADLPGRMDDAIAEFQEALRRQPNFSAANNNLGNAWAKQPGRLPDAIAQYEAALRVNPDYAEAHNNLGSAWSKVPGRMADAITEYRTALRLKPDYPEAHQNLGNAWVSQPDRLPDAIAEYEAALRLKPDYVEAHTSLGVALSKVPGRAEAALAQYDAALRLSPDYAQAHLNRGSLLLNLPGRLDEAIGEFITAQRLKPDYPEAYFNLGVAWMKRPERLNDAIGQFQAALRLKPDYVEAHNNLGNAWVSVPGRLNEAIGEYEATLRLDPNLADVRSNLGYALNAAGRTQDAIAEDRAALRLKPDSILAHLNLAIALLGTGADAEAKVQLEAVLRLQPANQPARRILAGIGAGRP